MVESVQPAVPPDHDLEMEAAKAASEPSGFEKLATLHAATTSSLALPVTTKLHTTTGETYTVVPQQSQEVAAVSQIMSTFAHDRKLREIVSLATEKSPASAASPVVFSEDYFEAVCSALPHTDLTTGIFVAAGPPLRGANRADFECAAAIHGAGRPGGPTGGTTEDDTETTTVPDYTGKDVADQTDWFFRPPQVASLLWDERITGFRFDVRAFLRSHGALSFQEMVTGKVLDQFLLKANEHLWQAQQEDEDQFLNSKYFVKPTSVASLCSSTPDHGLSPSLFPGLFVGPGGVFSLFTRKELAVNALVAEILNLLARNPPKALIEGERAAIAATEAERQAGPVVLLERQLAELQQLIGQEAELQQLIGQKQDRDVARLQQEVRREREKLAEMEENPFGPNSDPDKQMHVVAWKQDALSQVQAELDKLKEQELALLHQIDDVAEKMKMAAGTTDEGGALASESADENDAQHLPPFSFQSDFRLFHTYACDAGSSSQDTPTADLPANLGGALNRKEFSIYLLRAGEKITDPRGFLEGIMSGAAALYSRSDASVNVPKHSMEISFSRKAPQAELLCVSPSAPDAEEQGKIYYPLWRRCSTNTEVVNDPVLFGDDAVFDVPDHWLALRATNGPLRFQVGFSESGLFHGANTAANFFLGLRHNALEVSDLLLKEEALQCLSLLSACLLSTLVFQNAPSLRAGRSVQPSTPRAATLGMARLPILPLLQAALYYDVKMYPVCFGAAAEKENDTHSLPPFLLEVILWKLRELSPEHSYEEDHFQLLLETAYPKVLKSTGQNRESHLDRLKRMQLSFLHSVPKTNKHLSASKLRRAIDIYESCTSLRSRT
ncbi:unnamed protein product [Amoebophrya sp. A120]|nr:unnamed protein product [Amoebophrya sp. A120]|eukprot:GSA120T00002594001.1